MTNTQSESWLLGLRAPRRLAAALGACCPGLMLGELSSSWLEPDLLLPLPHVPFPWLFEFCESLYLGSGPGDPDTGLASARHR